MQACDVINPPSLGANMHACDVIGKGGEGAHPERQRQVETPARTAAPINDSSSDSSSDSDNEEVRKNERAVLIERLERALQEVQTSVFQGARTDSDGSLEVVKLRSMHSFWHFYNEFEDWFEHGGEFSEFDDAALSLIGTYVELEDDVEMSVGCYGKRGCEIRRMLKQLGAQEIWMTRDFLSAVREREDAQTYGAEVLRDFYGDDYW